MSTRPAGTGAPLGAVLAGGAGSRLHGAKPSATLGGRPLVAWAVAALAGALEQVVVVAKPATRLPQLDAQVAVWREPAQPAHPLAGIVWALERCGGRPVLACPVDLPLLTPDSVAALRDAPGPVAVAGGQPLLGRFAPQALAALRAAVTAGDSARAAIAALRPVIVELPEPELFNVNTPAELAAAEARLPAPTRR